MWNEIHDIVISMETFKICNLNEISDFSNVPSSTPGNLTGIDENVFVKLIIAIGLFLYDAFAIPEWLGHHKLIETKWCIYVSVN